jgi:pSer/pThr/pTyr-binding forkhead associated (FHA) protein
MMFTPDAAFCDNCGASLINARAPSPQQLFPQSFPSAPQPVAETLLLPGTSTARLMIGGQTIAVPRKSEIVIGRADAASGSFPDVDLTPFGASPQTGVSRVHAKLTWQGAWVIEDMNSTNGTVLRGQKLVPHQKTPIHTGDPLIIGTLQLTFYAS